MHMVVGNRMQGRSRTADIGSASHQRHQAEHGPHRGRSRGLRARTEPLEPGPVPLLRPRGWWMENPGLVRGYCIFTFTWRALHGHSRRCAAVQRFVDICRFIWSGLHVGVYVYLFRRVQLQMLSKGMKAHTECLFRVGHWAVSQKQDVSVAEVNRK